MLGTLIPIVAIFFAGIMLKVTNYVSKDVIEGIKKIASNIFLPVVVFNVMATADFSKDSALLLGMAVFIMILAFVLGFVAKKIIKKDYRDYVPFFSITFEGGMLGYALVKGLLGVSNLYYVATIDLAGAIITFTAWTSMLTKVAMKKADNQNSSRSGNSFLAMLKSPTLIASIIGFIFGITGLGKKILESEGSDIYVNTVEMFSVSLTPMILLSLGYGMKITKKYIKDALVIIATRIAIVASVCAVAILIFRNFVDFTHELKYTFIMYYCLPPSFLTAVYVKGKDYEAITACVLSIYIILSLIVFSVLLLI